MSSDVLPPSRRPGRHSLWRQMVKDAAEKGAVRSDIAPSPEEARLIGRRIRRAADAVGTTVRMSYEEPNAMGQTRWYARISPKEETK